MGDVGGLRVAETCAKAAVRCVHEFGGDPITWIDGNVTCNGVILLKHVKKRGR